MAFQILDTKNEGDYVGFYVISIVFCNNLYNIIIYY